MMDPGATDVEDHRRLVTALIAVVVGATAWNLITNLLLPWAWYLPANLVAAGALVSIAIWSGLTVDQLGLGRRNAKRGLVFGGAAALIVAVVLAVALLTPAGEAALEDDGVAADRAVIRWFMTLVRIPLGTALFEEVLFRSVLFGLFAALSGRRSAVVVTSVLFGLWHVAPSWGAGGSALETGGAVLGTVLVTSVGGAVFAWLRVRSDSVLAPMLAHWATNSLSYTAAIVALDVLD